MLEEGAGPLPAKLLGLDGGTEVTSFRKGTTFSKGYNGYEFVNSHHLPDPERIKPVDDGNEKFTKIN